MGDEVHRVLSARTPWEILQLPVRMTDVADVRRSYRQLALMLHPDKCSDADAQEAFVRLSTAYEQLSDSGWQLEALERHRRKGGKDTKRGGAGDAEEKPRKAKRAGKAPSFMDMLREWEEFEREYMEEMQREGAQLERQHRQERKRSMRADREEQEKAERAALASVLDDELEGRTASWSSFVRGKNKRKKQGNGDGEGTAGV